MADQREVFTILEDFSTGAGVRLPARQEGDTVADNHAPVIFCQDSSGNYIVVENRTEGEAICAALPGMVAKDTSGNLKYLEMLDAGDASAGDNTIPAFIAIDTSNNFQYLKVNGDGELIVSSESAGTAKHAQAQLTADGTMQDVADITLTASKVYEKIEFMGSNTFATAWEVVGIEDDAGSPVETVIAEFLTGPGQFTFADHLDWATYTAGTTGVLKLRIRGQQLHGPNSELRASIGALEKA
jgi:hypothetical protein